jgi:hypothetical protein
MSDENYRNFNKILASGNDTSNIVFGPPNNITWFVTTSQAPSLKLVFHRAVYQNYAGTVVPEGVNNKTFEGSNIQGATFLYQFSGETIIHRRVIKAYISTRMSIRGCTLLLWTMLHGHSRIYGPPRRKLQLPATAIQRLSPI